MNRNQTSQPGVPKATVSYAAFSVWIRKLLRLPRATIHWLTFSRTKYAIKCLELDMLLGYGASTELQLHQLTEQYKKTEAMLKTRERHTQNLEAIIGAEFGSCIYVSSFNQTELIVAINDRRGSYASIRVYYSCMGPAPQGTATLRMINTYFKLSCLSANAGLGEAVIERALVGAAIAHAKTRGAAGIVGAVLGSMISIEKVKPVFQSLGFSTSGDHRVMEFEKRFALEPECEERVLELPGMVPCSSQPQPESILH